MGSAYVYVQYITGTCIRANIYFFNAPEADSAYMYTCKVYYGHMYTCEDIYIMAYHLLLDSTKPYSGKPPHRASHGQA